MVVRVVWALGGSKVNAILQTNAIISNYIFFYFTMRSVLDLDSIQIHLNSFHILRPDSACRMDQHLPNLPPFEQQNLYCLSIIFMQKCLR